ncbi:putative endo-beta-1,4-glucanase D [Colletotrichum orbiculare MAFF 240422]|uniref:lytic cellulose monooxygenase (C4-dehydrogenating) n=1 Tax=Colletotrichum orbiculare (strain 104-T / ATCC 96160 / CBS 514.97 / LARS 414 / MAFF 240422) TaxID=1213857 RepID=N4VNV2_COLOR|nr:putative endo-beta-1,4-glucanase D [Colletotrichum orbiculare MAFF 240422]
MKTAVLSLLAVAAQQAASHATFQALWVDGVDFGGQCARLPLSNSPVTNVASNDVRCNANSGPVARKCAVKAGSSVVVEMHQQPSGRSCAEEAIGGAHYGPVLAYLTKVSDSSSADGSTGWFKIYQDGWAKASGSVNGDGDYWGSKDMNNCCGKVQVKIPSDIPAGDYLLRAESIALHAAGSSAGAQLYMTCFQLTVTGGGSASPPTVSFPGAYKASDPGLLVDIHRALPTYVVPGPAVYAGGSTKSAGSGCVGCEQTCTVGSGPTGTASAVPQPSSTGGSGGGLPGCTVAKFGQCDGQDYTGCKTCVSGSTCQAVSPPYYYQCA